MKQNKFPPGWDEKRVQSVIDYYENQTEDEAVAEDEEAFRQEFITKVEVPAQLVPAVHELIVRHRAQSRRQNNKMFDTSKVRLMLNLSRSKEWSSRWVHLL